MAMKKKYQYEIDRIHAPQALIEKTMAAARNQRRQPLRFPIKKLAAIAAMVVFMVATVSVWSLRTPSFTKVAESDLRSTDLFGLINPMRKQVQADSFDTQFGLAIQSIEKQNELYFITQSDPITGMAQFDCEMDGQVLQVYCGIREKPLPQTLQTAIEIETQGELVHFAQTETAYYAGWQKGDVVLIVMQGITTDASQQAFQSAVGKLTQQLFY